MEIGSMILIVLGLILLIATIIYGRKIGIRKVRAEYKMVTGSGQLSAGEQTVRHTLEIYSAPSQIEHRTGDAAIGKEEEDLIKEVEAQLAAEEKEGNTGLITESLASSETQLLAATELLESGKTELIAGWSRETELLEATELLDETELLGETELLDNTDVSRKESKEYEDK